MNARPGPAVTMRRSTTDAVNDAVIESFTSSFYILTWFSHFGYICVLLVCHESKCREDGKAGYKAGPTVQEAQVHTIPKEQKNGYESALNHCYSHSFTHTVGRSSLKIHALMVTASQALGDLVLLLKDTEPLALEETGIEPLFLLSQWSWVIRAVSLRIILYIFLVLLFFPLWHCFTFYIAVICYFI